uniref:Uncharacterized protein n=1 Tax=Arundo donax TaxID=35708 RepID=A0A0A9ECX4_ARUDO
MRLLPLLL